MEKSIVIPLTTAVSDDYDYQCEVSLEIWGHTAQAKLDVDTGAIDCTLSKKTATQLALTPMMKSQTLKAIAGTMPINFGGLETLGFTGGPSVHDLIVTLLSTRQK